MPSGQELAGAAGRASLFAGPIFLALLTLLSFGEGAGRTIEVNLLQLLPALLLIPLSVLVGVVVAFPTCLIAGSFLALVANVLPMVRSTALWLMIAAGIALAIVDALAGFSPGSASFAFILTAVACAAIVRTRLHWD